LAQGKISSSWVCTAFFKELLVSSKLTLAMSKMYCPGNQEGIVAERISSFSSMQDQGSKVRSAMPPVVPPLDFSVLCSVRAAINEFEHSNRSESDLLPQQSSGRPNPGWLADDRFQPFAGSTSSRQTEQSGPSCVNIYTARDHDNIASYRRVTSIKSCATDSTHHPTTDREKAAKQVTGQHAIQRAAQQAIAAIEAIEESAPTKAACKEAKRKEKEAVRKAAAPNKWKLFWGMLLFVVAELVPPQQQQLDPGLQTPWPLSSSSSSLFMDFVVFPPTNALLDLLDLLLSTPEDLPTTMEGMENGINSPISATEWLEHVLSLDEPVNVTEMVRASQPPKLSMPGVRDEE